jgi:hypothetical protein
MVAPSAGMAPSEGTYPNGLNSDVRTILEERLRDCRALAGGVSAASISPG